MACFTDGRFAYIFQFSKPPFLRYDNTDYMESKVKGIRIANARFSIT